MVKLNQEHRFEGFSAETVFFLKNLKENNNRDWFLARKKDYDKKVLHPAAEFVIEMGDMLQKLSPGIHAEPKVNRSIFRIYRDTRYSADQDPYKNNLSIWFWQGTRKVNESPGYYFELKPEQLSLAAGISVFSRKALRCFREAVADPKSGEELAHIVEKIEKNTDYRLNEIYYKNIPEGYQVQGRRADLIRLNGLMASIEMLIPAELYNRNLLKFVFNIYKDFSPIENWLTKYLCTCKQK